ncbi:DUF4097 family beta strand repeat-containing protein [Agromyces sp. G08B096]|uniref:DUF4097 family beta strand repeat-containing protein n=1 Tax=Agromyces sp. G08B096 TaxID=3156399 RepID=A0AAU7W6X5_9MICO
MTSTTRRLAAAAVSVAFLAGLSGCAFFAPEHRVSDGATVDERVDGIRIDAPQGSVTIRGGADATAITIERTVRYRGTEREIPASHEVLGGELVLGGCGRHCTVEYVVDVPAGLDVEGRTSNGSIELSAVGDVDVETDNGRIELDGVAGSVAAQTSNGRVIGRALAGGPIEVATSNGGVQLELETAQDVRATTSNGAIDLAVPDASYRVRTDTSNGGIDVGVPDDPDGEFTLDLRTSNGSITVTTT